MKKTVRILALLLVAAMLFSVSAAADEGEKGSYVALGDSIGAGYGLPGYYGDMTDPAGAYASIIAAEKGLKLNNLSVSGMTSSQLLTMLGTNAYAEAVKGAELITVSIGSNDILVPAMGLLMTSYAGMDYSQFMGGSSMTMSDMTDALETLNTLLNTDEAKAVFEEGCKTFEGNWDRIVSRIRELNPDAVIAVTGYYNPYSMLNMTVGLKEIKITDYIDTYIARLNAVIENSEMSGEYVIADVSDISTNVNIFALDPSLFSVDPHPDAAGHKLIAERLLEALDKAESKEESKPVAMLTNQAIKLDGNIVEAEVYNIDGSNYFRLRDVAYLLDGTKAAFSVDYDSATRVISLARDAKYAPDGSELRKGVDNSATVVLSNQPVTVDGESVSLKAYNLGGSNFFKLRDLGDALGFTVDYDSASRTVLIYSE